MDFNQKEVFDLPSASMPNLMGKHGLTQPTRLVIPTFIMELRLDVSMCAVVREAGRLLRVVQQRF